MFTYLLCHCETFHYQQMITFSLFLFSDANQPYFLAATNFFWTASHAIGTYSGVSSRTNTPNPYSGQQHRAHEQLSQQISQKEEFAGIFSEKSCMKREMKTIHLNVGFNRIFLFKKSNKYSKQNNILNNFFFLKKIEFLLKFFWKILGIS